MISIQKQNKISKLRFAPSPNGLLHLGHAYSAILTAKFAELLDGSFLLRIEDIDQARSKDQYIAAIFRDLHWLGLTWPEPVRRQSDHFPTYQTYIDQLSDAGLIYPCFASRKQIKDHWQIGAQNQPAGCTQSPPTDPDGALLYPGLYKDLSPKKAKARMEAGEPFTLRLHMDKAIKRAKKLQKGRLTYQSFDERGGHETHLLAPERWGDVVIARKDVPTSYHLSVVVDDHLQTISHICRGKDLEAATDVHRILQINLGLNEPHYHHHQLIELEGEKLSKSKAHPSLYQLRQNGLKADQLIAAAKQGPDALTSLLP